MSADVADRKDIILEQFVLDGGVVVLDSWRLQIRNGSENAERRRARGVRPVGLEGNGRIRHVVSHGVTNSEGGLAVAEDVPGQSGARAKVSKVQVIEAGEPLLQLHQTVRETARRADRRLRRSAGEEIRTVLIGIPQRAIEVPAQAVADDHTRRHLPLILEKESQGGLVDVTCSVAEGTRGPIQPAKEQLCEDNVHASDRNRGRRIRRRPYVVTLETEQARP